MKRRTRAACDTRGHVHRPAFEHLDLVSGWTTQVCSCLRYQRRSYRLVGVGRRTLEDWSDTWPEARVANVVEAIARSQKSKRKRFPSGEILASFEYTPLRLQKALCCSYSRAQNIRYGVVKLRGAELVRLPEVVQAALQVNTRKEPDSQLALL